jgi:hypothetical protein
LVQSYYWFQCLLHQCSIVHRHTSAGCWTEKTWKRIANNHWRWLLDWWKFSYMSESRLEMAVIGAGSVVTKRYSWQFFWAGKSQSDSKLNV